MTIIITTGEADPGAFRALVLDWAVRTRTRPGQVRIQRMSRKWASCSSCGWVTFSEDLLVQPLEFQEYVIVHELLHLKVPNHGKLFRSLLSAHLPRRKMDAAWCAPAGCLLRGPVPEPVVNRTASLEAGPLHA